MLTINGKDYNAPSAAQLLLGEQAYERYGGVTDFLNFRGEAMPAWTALPPVIQFAWVAAADPTYLAKQRTKPTEEELAQAVAKIRAEYSSLASRKNMLDITSDLIGWLCNTYSEGWLYDVLVRHDLESDGFSIEFKRIDAKP